MTVSLPAAAAAIARGRLTIVAFGSSTTEGVGASAPDKTYPARLEAELRAALPAARIDVINRGQGGEEAEDLARRYEGVIADRPDLIIFQTGTNDAIRGVPLARFLELTRAGLDAFRRAGIDVMLMDPQHCRAIDEAPDAQAYIDAVRALGDEYRVPVIRRNAMMREWLATGRLTPAEMVTDDDLHMADGGYAELARAVAAQILDATRG